MVIQVYALNCNAEEAEVEWFYEDLQDLLELTPEKGVLFIIGDWNVKVGNQERNCCLVGVTIILGLCSTQYRVEGNTENCGYDPVSLTENTSQHPMQTQGLQVQEPTFLLP